MRVACGLSLEVSKLVEHSELSGGFMNALETRAVHAGRRDLAGLGVHVPSIDLSTTNPLADVESGGDAYEALATGRRPIPGGSHVYGRLWNQTVARFSSTQTIVFFG